MNKNTFKNIRILFSGFELTFQFIFLFFINFCLFYTVSKHMNMSIAIGVIGMLFFFFVYSYPNKKLRNYQANLDELMKYVTNTVFYLETGSTVYDALKGAVNTVNGDVQKDIKKTLKIMEENASLEVEHFRKYKFPALNQFHEILKIRAEFGKEKKTSLSGIQRNMMFELKKRDELYKKRKAFARNVYVLLGAVGLMTFVLRFFVTELWDIFLNYGVVGLSVLIATYFMVLLNLYFLQRKKLDISVTL